MAYCRTVKIGDSVAIVRFSGKPPALCHVCRRAEHTKLCDFKQPGARKTCDKPLCDDCAVHRFGADFCPDHELPKALGEVAA